MNRKAEEIWTEFLATRSAEGKRAIILRYMDLVRYVVAKMGMKSLGNMHGLTQQDLVHFGILGLMNAIDRYTPAGGVKFETYAIPRIRGAILDELRGLDWVPRSVRQKTKELERVSHHISQQQGREAVGMEIAEKLNMTPEEFQDFLSETAPQSPARPERDRGDEEGESRVEQIPGDAPDPFQALSDDESKSILVRAVEHLPARDRTIIALYYYENLRFSEIGKILRISESRVSQIHSQVLRDLKQALVAEA